MSLLDMSDAGILIFDRCCWCWHSRQLRGKAAFFIYRCDWEINWVFPSVDILSITRIFCLVNAAADTWESCRKSVFLNVNNVLPAQRMAQKEMWVSALLTGCKTQEIPMGKKWLMWINSTQHMRVKQIHLKHHWDRTEVLKRVSKKIATHRRAVTSVKTDTEYTAKQHTGRNQVCSCRFTDKHLGIGERAQWLTQLTKTQDLPLCRVLTPKALKCLPHLILCPQFRHLGA